MDFPSGNQVVSGRKGQQLGFILYLYYIYIYLVHHRFEVVPVKRPGGWHSRHHPAVTVAALPPASVVLIGTEALRGTWCHEAEHANAGFLHAWVNVAAPQQGFGCNLGLAARGQQPRAQ